MAGLTICGKQSATRPEQMVFAVIGAGQNASKQIRDRKKWIHEGCWRGQDEEGAYCQDGLHRGSRQRQSEYFVRIDLRKKFMRAA